LSDKEDQDREQANDCCSFKAFRRTVRFAQCDFESCNFLLLAALWRRIEVTVGVASKNGNLMAFILSGRAGWHRIDRGHPSFGIVMPAVR
jgi:hypothetical protein